MGPHKRSLRWIPPRGINNSGGQKRTITSSKFKSKKLFLGEEIKQKETQMGPHRGSEDDPATGDKIILVFPDEEYDVMLGNL